MENKTFIIQGNIASGKTTLCKLLELQNIDKTEVIYEPVDKWISLTDSNNNNIGNNNNIFITNHRNGYLQKKFIFRKSGEHYSQSS